MGRSTVVARRAALACAAALLAIGPTAVATAAPISSAPVRTDLPPALVSAIERDLKLTPEQYMKRADDAQRLGAFEAPARKNFPTVFAGAWLDHAGRPIVALADGAAKPAARKAAQDAGFTVLNVAKSEVALQKEKSDFDHWVASKPKAVAENVRGVAIDTVHNAVVARVASLGGLQLPGMFNGMRLITSSAPVAAERLDAKPIAGADPGPAVIAGQPYAAVDNEHALRCSIGFNGTDGRGNIVNITAGHCNPDVGSGGTAGMFSVVGNQIGAPMGTFAKSVLGNHDYSIVRINPENAPRFANNLVAVPGAAPLAIAGIAVPVVGMPACKSGSRTGFNCGVVNAVDQSVQVGDHQLNNSFSMNICALPGDSGGPVVTGNRALGISSASSVADYPICQIPEFLGMFTGDVPQLFAQPVAGVLAENPGLHVRTN